MNEKIPPPPNHSQPLIIKNALKGKQAILSLIKKMRNEKLFDLKMQETYKNIPDK